MYSKYKRYEDKNEYVRDLTGCTYKEPDSGNLLLGFIWFIVIVLAIVNMSLDSLDPDASIGTILFIFVFAIVAILGGPKIYKYMTKDEAGEEAYRCFKEVIKVIDSIPLKNEWKDIDQAVSDMMMKKLLKPEEISKIKSIRDKAFNKVNRYTYKEDKICEYAETVDEIMINHGKAPLFKSLIEQYKEKKANELKDKEEKKRQEELKARKEAELTRKRATQEEKKREQREKEEHKRRIEKAKRDLDSNIPLKMIRKKLENTGGLLATSMNMTDEELKKIVIEYLDKNPGLEVFDIIKGDRFNEHFRGVFHPEDVRK